jgi:drug/metabolite transporter (DMT)-like permease
LTLLVSAPMLGVYPSRRQLVGVLGGLACMALLFGDALARHVPPGDLALAASVPLCYAVTNVYIRQRLADLSALALSIAGLVLTALMLLPLGLLVEPARLEGDVSQAVACVAVLGVLGTGLGTYLFNRLIQEQGPLFAGMTTYLVPVGAVVWGWLDDEQVTLMQLGALVGIFSMVALVQFGAARPTRIVHVEGENAARPVEKREMDVKPAGDLSP